MASADHLREQLAARVEELQRTSAQQYAAITATNSRVEGDHTARGSKEGGGLTRKQRPAELTSWVEEVRGTEVDTGCRANGQSSAGIGRPVATLFGAYDTGKSSVLRRLA